MKILLTIALLFLSAFTIFAKKIEPLTLLNCSKVKGDYLWFANTEVTNANYREFLTRQQGKLDKKEFVKLLPDTTAWKKILGNSEPYINYYFRHPAYNQYPVVCVSKKQAEAFCVFLTDLFNEMFVRDASCNYQRVIVRLPTQEEWTFAAIGGLSLYNEYPWDGNDVLITEGKFKGSVRANFLRTNEAFGGVSGGLGAKDADVLAPSKSYWPNGFGLYNMSGNAAELVADGSKVMGGSFREPYNEIKVNSSNKEEVSGTVGFRYVVEIQKFKPMPVKSKIDLTKKSFYKKQFIKLNDTLSIMQTEVTNELYQLFCKETNISRPDSTLWKNEFYGSQQYVNHYNWHSKYANYPVVAITKEEADKFCFWLTQHYVRAFSISAQIRLPKKEELKLALEKSYEVNLESDAALPGVFNGNVRLVEGTYSGDLTAYFNSILFKDIDGIETVAPVNHSVSKKLKIYNLTGNVDELLNDATTYLSRNWKSVETDWGFKTVKQPKASTTVGIRCVLILN